MSHIHYALCQIVLLFAAVLMPFSAATAVAQSLPMPATGGKDGGPIDLLIYRGHCEMNFGVQPQLDPTYMKKLEDQGYRITVLGPVTIPEKGETAPTVGEWRPLTLEYLKQFNAVIYLSPSPYLGGGYFDHTRWRSGGHMLTIRDNLDVLQNYVEQGGGLMIIPSLEELGMRTTESLKDLFGRYGATTECAAVRDESRAFIADKILGVFPVIYSWTEALADHPVTRDVNRIWYPAYCTRWDDNYTTIPLFPKDPAWTSVVKAEPDGRAYWLRGTVYDPKATWHEAQNMPTDPSIFMVRQLGKGRVAISGVGAYHLFYLTYSEIGKFAEANFAIVDGIAMEHGNTNRQAFTPKKTKKNPDPQPVQTFTDEQKVPSDMHVLLSNTYRWLAEPSAEAGWGGYDSANGIEPGQPRAIDDDHVIAAFWADKDPLVNPENIRPMRILVGARSAMSSGQGSPADWAKAAKEAGYDVVCFTETLEDVDIPRWSAFVEACAAASDEDVYLLPGLDIPTDLDDRFLVVGHTLPIRTHILTADHKKMWWTGHMLLGMGDTLPIVSRPAHHARSRGDKGALPPELYVACPGVAIKTYKDGKEVDDGIFAWQWQAHNASQPIPVTVHEVDAPGEMLQAASTGLQNYINADKPHLAGWYFRQGHATFGGFPMRYYVSSGPVVESASKQSRPDKPWKARIVAKSHAPITDVTVSDQFGVYRHFQPGENEVDVAFFGDNAVERWMTTHIKDASGGEAYICQMRTLQPKVNIRCMDRQNWFTPLNWNDISYTCKTVTKGASISVPGVTLAAEPCPKLSLVFNGLAMYVHDNLYDSTWVPDGNRFMGDNSPLWHDLPIPEYEGYARFVTMDKRGYRQYISRVTLKQDLTPKGDVWPVGGSVAVPKDGITYIYNDPTTGEKITGVIAKDGYIDLPVGGTVPGLLALSPLRIDSSGNVGHAAPDGTATAGSTYEMTWLNVQPGEEELARKTWGFEGQTPYTLTLSQGQLKQIAWQIDAQAQDDGIAGSLKGATDLHENATLLRLLGANDRRPLGFWNASTNDITPYSYFEGKGIARLKLTEDVTFYFGNLLLADHDDLYLAFASQWDEQGAVVEVTNPTSQAITATIRSPKAITGRKALNQVVTVPAGQTIQVQM